MAQGFDPAAATAAYLAQLTPEAHAKAQAYTQGGHWLILWGSIVSVAIAWIVLRSGVLVKVRARVERGRPRPWLAVGAVVVVDAVAETVLNLPWDAYRHWFREKAYGLTSQPLTGWLTDQGLGLAVGLVQIVIVISLLYWLIRRAPRTWWLWGSGVTAAVFTFLLILQPIFVEPLFNKYTPAPAGPVRDEVVTMAKQVGVPYDKIYIYNGSKQSNRYTANVAGLFGTARVAMSDVMFQKGADLAEVRGVVGHEMGHYKRGHLLWTMLVFVGLSAAAFFLVDRLFPVVARLTGARGVTGLADPAGFPVIGVILTVLSLLATPILNSVTRVAEADADRYSLEHFNEPDGLAKALAKTIEYRAATPSRIEEIIFYDHPAVGSRIRRAMDWKAAHPKSAPPAPTAS